MAIRGMILAAGLGTRLKPFTDKHPKALAVVNGKTVLQRNIEWLAGYGIKDVIVNVHHFADQIIAALNENRGWGSNVVISDESDEVLETGGGILKAAPFLKAAENCVVMNADILTDFNLQKAIEQHQALSAIATLAVTDRVSSRVLQFDEANRLVGWKNTSDGAVKGKEGISKAFSGIQVLNQSFFDKIELRGKFSVIDVYLALCKGENIYGYNHSGSRFIDIGTQEKLDNAAKMFD